MRGVGLSANTVDCDAAASSNHENQTNSKDGSNYSKFSDRGLDLITARLEAVAEELERRKIRDEKIRKIEALRERCKSLGVNICQQDLEAWVNESGADSNASTITSQRNPNQGETQAQADGPQDVEPAPISGTQFAQDSETTLMEDGPANSISDTLAEPQTPLRSMRPLRGRKRAHSQLEQPSTDVDSDHDSEYVRAGGQSPSPDRTESLQSEDGQRKAGRQNDSPIVSVNGVAMRTAWASHVAKYPGEVASIFRPGERPKNRQIIPLLDLPAVNSLVDNPMRRARCKPWSIQHVDAPRRIDYLVAALTQLTGKAALEPCDRCENGSGLWKGCYTTLLVGDPRLDGKTNACANCMLHRKSSKCR